MRKRQTHRRFSWRTAALLCAGLSSYHEVFAAGPELVFGVRDVGQQLVVRSLDLNSTQPVLDRAHFADVPGHRVSGFFQGKDRSLSVLFTSHNSGKGPHLALRNVGLPEHIMDVSTTQESALASSESLSSVLLTAAGQIIGLVSHFSDTPPFALVVLDIQGGKLKLLKRERLDPVTRYGHLTQCPDGSVYITSSAQQIGSRVVQLDLNTLKTTPLADFDPDTALFSDISDLACAPSNKLYALADPTYARSNSLFEVNRTTGQLKLLRAFDVDRIVFVR